MYKLEHAVGNEWCEHSHPATYRRETTSAGTERLVAGIPGGDGTIIRTLAHRLRPPFFLLYVLHTPRGEAEPGRYQSGEIDLPQLDRFLSDFDTYLKSDSRFDFWVHASEEAATIVWDRHNLLYAYGPLPKFETALAALGFVPGQPSMNFDHIHNYRPECDADAARLIAAFDWSYSPLRPQDEQ